MKKRLFIFYLLMFLFALPSQAVLKEKDLNNTLSILRNELTQTHQEQKRMQIKFKNSSDKVKKNLFAILSKSNQNALMLYSQKLDYVFD